jgi:Lrp/AsnC family leucine-responsive transcriptional regulator
MQNRCWSIYFPGVIKINRKIVETLMGDATVTNAQLGALVGLSSSAAHERVCKLKKQGVIKKIVALVASDFLNMSLGAFISVFIEKKEHDAAFLSKIKNHPNVLECHHTTGEHSYLLKVRMANTQALEDFINNFLKNQLGITKTTTQIILSSPKENPTVVS